MRRVIYNINQKIESIHENDVKRENARDKLDRERRDSHSENFSIMISIFKCMEDCKTMVYRFR